MRIFEAKRQEVGTGLKVEDILEKILEANNQEVRTGLRTRIFLRGHLRPVGKRWAQASGRGYS